MRGAADALGHVIDRVHCARHTCRHDAGAAAGEEL